MAKLFNGEVKALFLKSIVKEETAKAYSRIFSHSLNHETFNGKDLYDFNKKEIAELLKDIHPNTKPSARSTGNTITKYISWARENGYTKNNPLSLETVAWFEQFVVAQDSNYITKDELDYILDTLINYSDALIIKLLFEGVQGKEASEIRGLKTSDILTDGEKYFLKVVDSKNDKERLVEVDYDTVSLAEKSHELETEYIKKNGEMVSSGNIKDTVELPEPESTPYVIKTGKTNNTHYGKMATKFTIYNRIEMIRQLDTLLDAGIKPESLTTKNIVKSGMIYEGYKYLKANKELNKSAIDKICKKYNVKNYWAVKDFLNTEVIEKLYGRITPQPA